MKCELFGVLNGFNYQNFTGERSVLELDFKPKLTIKNYLDFEKSSKKLSREIK